MKQLLLLTALCGLALTASAATESFRKTVPLGERGSLSLENVNGSIELLVWDRPEVCIEAEKKAPTEEGLRRTQIEVDASGDKVSIQTHTQRSFFSWNNNTSVHYRISVPATLAKAHVQTVNGEIRSLGVPGSLRLKTVNGRIQADDTQGSSELRTVNGSVRLTIRELPAKGHVEVETTNGSCELGVPARLDAHLKAGNTNGGIHCELPLSNVEKKKHHLQGTLGEGSASVRVNTVNGSVTVQQR